MSDTTERYEYEVRVIRKEPKAMLVQLESGVRWWAPRSQLAAGEDLEEGEEGTIEVPAWLAEKEGLE